ncbi:MAG: Uma2 family endonuclease [Fimbriimonadales bacterium]|nr:Uma2 family endonuclease [Fimbriimonadales bacterium]
MSRAMPIAPAKEHWTLEEWLQTEMEPRCELDHGRLIPMASPTRKHQDIVLTTAYEARRHTLIHRLGALLMEVDVALPIGKGVIPDISFVSREREVELLTPEGKVRGAPDLVVEVVSPSTRTRDTVEKLRDYYESKVPWYWLIDSETLVIQELQWTPDGYVIRTVAEPGEVFRSKALEGFELNLQALLGE